jgi:sugar lactone lactonase YvrE
MKKTLLSLLLSVLAISLMAQAQKIVFEAPQVYPEGVAFDPHTKLFYVSSATTGTIGTVDETGKYTVFYKDKTLRSSFGMKIDAERNRLWVCTGDDYSRHSNQATSRKKATLIVLDLGSGKKMATIDLSTLYHGNHFTNDLAFDEGGNLFITDSYSPVIYKIDAKYRASIFAQSDMFRSRDVGLNGIVYHPDGFLLVVNNSAGSILKVNFKDPDHPAKVEIKEFFPGADGLLLDKENNLILVQNKGVNKIFQIGSTDRWKTAEIIASTSVADGFQNPTTATANAADIFVLNSKMDELSDSTKNPSKAYSIQQAVFRDTVSTERP